MAKSKYETEHSISPNDLRRCSAVRNVGALKRLLIGLPDNLPIDPREDGVKLVWFNVGQDNEHLSFEENDGTFDD